MYPAVACSGGFAETLRNWSACRGVRLLAALLRVDEAWLEVKKDSSRAKHFPSSAYAFASVQVVCGGAIVPTERITARVGAVWPNETDGPDTGATTAQRLDSDPGAH